MISYSRALEVYNNSKAPKRSNTWLSMPDSARYLHNVRATHYGIHKTADGAIYFRLYSTNLVTLYPPNENGEYRVDVRYVHTQTTRKFMWWWGLDYDNLNTNDGRCVAVPYVGVTHWRDGDPTAKLMFDASDKLIVDKSWHEQIYTKVSSAEDKVQRKMIRQAIKNLVTLNEFRLHTFKENCQVHQYLGQPFGTSYRNMPMGIGNLESHIKYALRDNAMRDNGYDLSQFDFNDNKFIELFMDAGQDVFNILASHRVYSAGLFKWVSRWNKTQAEIQDMDRKQIEERVPVINEISGEELNKAFVNRLLSLFGVKEGTALKDRGQFPNKLPNKWYTK